MDQANSPFRNKEYFKAFESISSAKNNEKRNRAVGKEEEEEALKDSNIPSKPRESMQETGYEVDEETMNDDYEQILAWKVLILWLEGSVIGNDIGYCV